MNNIPDHIRQMDKSINALALELHQDIWNDVHYNWMGLKGALIESQPDQTAAWQELLDIINVEKGIAVPPDVIERLKKEFVQAPVKKDYNEKTTNTN